MCHEVNMKAAYINGLGPPENIIFGDVPEPAIEDSQALIKVAALAAGRHKAVIDWRPIACTL
jgi:hypothetical protein